MLSGSGAIVQPIGPAARLAVNQQVNGFVEEFHIETFPIPVQRQRDVVNVETGLKKLMNPVGTGLNRQHAALDRCYRLAFKRLIVHDGCQLILLW